MSKNNHSKAKALELSIDWSVPDNIIARYATNMVVQRAEHEYIISFFEIKPPVLLGSPDEIIEQAKKLKSMRANCVSQIIVAADKMPSFVDALVRNLKRSAGEVEDKEESE